MSEKRLHVCQQCELEFSLSCVCLSGLGGTIVKTPRLCKCCRHIEPNDDDDGHSDVHNCFFEPIWSLLQFVSLPIYNSCVKSLSATCDQSNVELDTTLQTLACRSDKFNRLKDFEECDTNRHRLKPTHPIPFHREEGETDPNPQSQHNKRVNPTVPFSEVDCAPWTIHTSIYRHPFGNSWRFCSSKHLVWSMIYSLNWFLHHDVSPYHRLRSLVEKPVH